MDQNPILDLLRATRGDLAGLRADMVEVKERLGNLEATAASVSRRVDRLANDVAAIRRRLDPLCLAG